MIPHRAIRGWGKVSAFAGVSSLPALMQCLWLLTGAMGINLGHGFSVCILALAFLLSLLFASRFREPPAVSEGPVETGGDRVTAAIAWCITGVALLWFLWVWGELWSLAYQRPPYDWDGLYYHLPAINGWAVKGRIGWVDGGPDVPFVNFPMGVEATTFIANRILETSRLVTAGNLWYWPLAFFSITVIASLLGARAPWPWWAAAGMVSAPVIVCQSVTCYTDPGFAATVMGSMAATGLLVFDHSRPLRWRALLWGANLGLMAGAKGTGAPFAAVSTAVVLVALFLVQGRDRWRSWLGPVIAAVCVAIAVGGIWYLRNAWITGNPIHPIELKFGAKVLLPGYDYVAFSEANLPAWLAQYPRPLRMPVSWLQLDAPIQGYAPVGGMGYLWLTACVPAILLLTWRFLRRRSDPRTAPFILFAALSLLLLAAQTSSWWSRFTVWLLGFGLPCLAVLLQTWRTAARRWWQKGALVLCLSGALGLAVWESNRTLQLERRTGRNPQAAVGEPTFFSSSRMLFPGLAETPGVERFLREGKIARSPWGRLGTLLGGVLALPLGARDIAILSGNPTEQDLDRVRRAGVGWVLWDVVGAGAVPEVIRRVTEEEVVFHPAPDVDFRFLRMAAPD